MSWGELRRESARLASCDFGGEGRAVVCLHGLAGHAGEWANTAAALVPDFRVLALDQRGHGRSERHPSDVSRAAFVADVAFVIEQLQLAPAVLVGQSMGGNTAFLTAAACPEQIAALVVIEASPDGPTPELARTSNAGWIAGRCHSLHRSERQSSSFLSSWSPVPGSRASSTAAMVCGLHSTKGSWSSASQISLPATVGHFEIYVGEPFEQAVTDQTEFLTRTLAPMHQRR